MRFGLPLESTRTSFAIRAILYKALTSPTLVLQVFLVRLVEAVQKSRELPFVETQVDKLAVRQQRVTFIASNGVSRKKPDGPPWAPVVARRRYPYTP